MKTIFSSLIKKVTLLMAAGLFCSATLAVPMTEKVSIDDMPEQCPGLPTLCHIEE
ncbi:hypothetical protein [Shewanella surugensis]|uniref:Uncharacterized protein n=1 Tax=Shewanella surugensis TaxID=212020 RepID=A0ABT0LIZ2_9GAMM|nr:hypothetical protein [Shewanella surugensis]MCL1127425.1 hypothetical protein [Shewanella surugensis]